MASCYNEEDDDHHDHQQGDDLPRVEMFLLVCHTATPPCPHIRPDTFGIEKILRDVKAGDSLKCKNTLPMKHKNEMPQGTEPPAAKPPSRKERKTRLEQAAVARQKLVRDAELLLPHFLNPVNARLEKIKREEGPYSDIILEQARTLETKLHHDYEQWMKKIKALDRTEKVEWPPDGRPARYDEQQDTFLLTTPSGTEIPSTMGLLTASFIWNGQYRFDHHTPSEVQLNVVLLESLLDMVNQWNRITGLLESINWFNRGGKFNKAHSYEEVAAQSATDPDHWSSGLLGEKMAVSLLTQILDDHLESGIKIVHAPIDFNVERKSDIIVADEKNQLYGIQFATTTDPEYVARKRHQVVSARANEKAGPPNKFRLQDIFLVAIHMDPIMVRDVYRRWKADERNLTGGPEQLLDRALQQEIFIQCLAPIIGEKKAKELWDRTLVEKPA